MIKQVKKAFVKQHDQSDCGVACMVTLVQYFGGECSMEKVRELSGTDKQGTTMLGLTQAAPEVGLIAEAFEADLANLREHKGATILHVVIDKTLMHYVVCYGFIDGKWLISDPAKGVKQLTDQELEEIWVSKALLTVEPGPGFQKIDALRKEKWNWIKRLVKEDANILSIALVMGVGISILSLATAVFSQKLIDDILPNNHMMKLKVGLALLFFLLIVKGIMSYIRQTFLIRQSKDFNNRIIHYFYGSLMYLPKRFFDNRKTGDLVARMNDTMRIQGAVGYISANLMIDFLLILTSATFIFVYSGTLGLIALVSIPLYFLITYLYHNQILTRQQNVMSSYALNESNFVDSIQGIGTIKVNNREDFFTKFTQNIYNQYQERYYELGTTRIAFNLTTELAGAVMILILISLSSFYILDDRLKLGAMMAIVQMVGMLLPAAGRLAMTNIMLQEARVAFDRMYEFTSIEPELIPENDSKKEHFDVFESLEVKQLSFRFPGRAELLTDISLHVNKGEMIAILGESGCGKSTLLQVFQKFYHYESGSITLNGKPWENISIQSLRKLIGVVSQDVKVFNGNVIDNICLGEIPEDLTEIETLCKEYGLHDMIMNFPQGYATIVGEEGANLSGGQKQILAIARALYGKPRLLLLDEATSALDRNTEQKILHLMTQLRQQMGVVLVTHRIKTASKADRIYVVEKGRIQSVGNHHSLLKEKNLYSEAWADYV